MLYVILVELIVKLQLNLLKHTAHVFKEWNSIFVLHRGIKSSCMAWGNALGVYDRFPITLTLHSF